MSRFRNAVLMAALLATAGFAAAQSSKYPGVGRNATAKEVAAWDIDVRPDFKGLPKGSGSVEKGMEVWEAKCASCHGTFADSNEVFSPIVGMGGISEEDIKTGHVAKLRDSSYPGRTTFMKVATLSTIWDYINRAMPWTAPKTLKTDEVYAVTAFLLNLAGVVPEDFTLSDKNIADVQKRMPNRNGMDRQHNMWPGKEFSKVNKADTKNTACMKNCTPEPKVASFLPDYARNAHGNLAEQNRIVGAQLGADTTKPEPKSNAAARASVKSAVEPKPAANAKKAAAGGGELAKQAQQLLAKNGCTACHAVDRKVMGPSFQDVGKKHAGKADYIAGKIKGGSSGVWGAIPMPPMAAVSDADLKTLSQWIAAGAAK